MQVLWHTVPSVVMEHREYEHRASAGGLITINTPRGIADNVRMRFPRFSKAIWGTK